MESPDPMSPSTTTDMVDQYEEEQCKKHLAAIERVREIARTRCGLDDEDDLLFGYKPLIYTINNVLVEETRLLLEARANPNIECEQDNYTVSLLGSCCLYRDNTLAMQRLLLEHGADPNWFSDNPHMTPIHCAMYFGTGAQGRQMIEFGASLPRCPVHPHQEAQSWLTELHKRYLVKLARAQFIWRPALHRNLARATRDTIQTMLVLRHLTPVIAHIPNEIMFQIFEFFCL